MKFLVWNRFLVCSFFQFGLCLIPCIIGRLNFIFWYTCTVIFITLDLCWFCDDLEYITTSQTIKAESFHFCLFARKDKTTELWFFTFISSTSVTNFRNSALLGRLKPWLLCQKQTPSACILGGGTATLAPKIQNGFKKILQV